MSPEGKTGVIKLTDKIKLLNLWGESYYLNTCWWTSDCGSNPYYQVTSVKKSHGDASLDTSNWTVSTNIDMIYTKIPYYFRNQYRIKPFMGSCGYSKICTSNYAVGTYNPYNSYVTKDPDWGTWIFKKKDNPDSDEPLSFNDIVTIQLKASGRYLVACDYSNCTGQMAVSLSKNLHKNHGYWKIVSPEGKTGVIKLTDKIKLLGGEAWYLNTCGMTNDCGSNPSYQVTLVNKSQKDAGLDKSNWTVSTTIDPSVLKTIDYADNLAKIAVKTANTVKTAKTVILEKGKDIMLKNNPHSIDSLRHYMWKQNPLNTGTQITRGDLGFITIKWGDYVSFGVPIENGQADGGKTIFGVKSDTTHFALSEYFPTNTNLHKWRVEYIPTEDAYKITNVTNPITRYTAYSQEIFESENPKLTNITYINPLITITKTGNKWNMFLKENGKRILWSDFSDYNRTNKYGYVAVENTESIITPLTEIADATIEFLANPYATDLTETYKELAESKIASANVYAISYDYKNNAFIIENANYANNYLPNSSIPVYLTIKFNEEKNGYVMTDLAKKKVLYVNHTSKNKQNDYGYLSLSDNDRTLLNNEHYFQFEFLKTKPPKTEHSGDGVKTCAIGLTSITTWAECKSQNALANAVPVQYEFNDNNWPYGCLIISGKLFFNGKLDSTATEAGSSGQRLLCKLTSESAKTEVLKITKNIYKTKKLGLLKITQQLKGGLLYYEKNIKDFKQKCNGVFIKSDIIESLGDFTGKKTVFDSPNLSIFEKFLTNLYKSLDKFNIDMIWNENDIINASEANLLWIEHNQIIDELRTRYSSNGASTAYTNKDLVYLTIPTLSFTGSINSHIKQITKWIKNVDMIFNNPRPIEFNKTTEFGKIVVPQEGVKNKPMFGYSQAQGKVKISGDFRRKMGAVEESTKNILTAMETYRERPHWNLKGFWVGVGSTGRDVHAYLGWVNTSNGEILGTTFSKPSQWSHKASWYFPFSYTLWDKMRTLFNKNKNIYKQKIIDAKIIIPKLRTQLVDFIKKMERLKIEIIMYNADQMKKQNELNDMPKVHSKFSNYELYLKLGTNKVAYSVIKNGTYWADKAYQLKASQADYDNVMGKNIDKREVEFNSIQKSYSII